jgi:DNA-binding response OmpR family regulator
VVSELGHGAKFIVETTFPTWTAERDAQSEPIFVTRQNSQRSLQGKYIAVIEDNPVIVEAYRQTLTTKGAYVKVLSEFEGEMDAQLATIDRIDCILSDYRLSQTTGDVLIQKLRDCYNEDIPAIIVTADTSPSHFKRFAKLNVQVLHKPLSFRDVATAIEKTIDAQ